MNLQTQVAGMSLAHPLMNAAGTCKTLEHVRELARSAVSAIMLGSMTIEDRAGNTGINWWTSKTHSLNTLGLPNRGIAYFQDVLPEMVAIAHGEGKLLIVSVAGFSPEQYGILTEVAIGCGVDAVEENFGCPNVWGRDGTQKRITCFDPELTALTLEQIKRCVGLDHHIWVKVSPFSDPFALAQTASVLAQSQVVRAVTSMNTFPNAFGYEQNKSAIAASEGFAGLSGPAIKLIGLGQIRQLRKALPSHIPVIGVGGITHGEDIWQYRDSGAAAVQVATTYVKQGAGVFSRLLSEYIEFCETNGV